MFGFDSVRGLKITFSQRFPLIWRGGVIDDGGIRSARFGFDSPALQVPDSSGNYPGFTVDFTRSRGLRIPFSGDVALPEPGGTTSPIQLRIGVEKPLWLTLNPDGRISLIGGGELTLPNGGFFRADLRLDDPMYQFQIAADRVNIPALGSLVDLLPAGPETCIPAAATAAQLDQATRCLGAFARAYANFSAAVIATAPGDTRLTLASEDAPPDPFAAVSSALEAWGFSALAKPTQNLPLDGIRELLRQFGQSASGASDLESATALRLALLRAKAAQVKNNLTGTPEARAELDAALAEAEAAALARANEPDAVSSLESMRQIARLMLEAEAVRQEANVPAGPLLTTALPALFNRFGDRYAASLGVQAGAFLPGNNPAIAGLNRFAAAEAVRTLVELMADAQLLGITLTSTPIDEALGQLAVRMFLAADAAANAAEAVGDLPAFVLALQDVTDLVAHRQLAIFPNSPQLNFLPGVGDLPGYAARLNALALAELDKPFGERSLNNRASEIRALLRVLRQMPATVTFPAGPFQRAFDQLETALASAVGDIALAAENSLPNLLDVLEAGTLHAELGRRFNFAAPVSWETQRLPRVITRLAEGAQQQRGWSQLDQAERAMFNAADRLNFLGDQIRRKAYLDQSAVLLNAARVVARSVIQVANPVLQVADMFLPGDIRVNNVAGSIRYQRFTGAVSGSFRGSLQLPKFGTALTINNASFSNGGSFAIDAFGELKVPADHTLLTATVPASDPLRVSWTQTEGLRLSASAKFALANGMFLKGSIGLLDPVYRFSLEAGGMQFALFNSMLQKIPALPAQADFTRNNAQNISIEHKSSL